MTPSAAEVESRLAPERVRLLYGQSGAAIAISPALALVLCMLLWGVSDHRRLLVWLLLLVALAVVRGAYLVAFRRRAAPQTDAPLAGWQRSFVVTSLLVAAAWGFGSVWVMPPRSLAYQALTFAAVYGLAGGIGHTYSVHRRLAFAMGLLLLLPMTVAFALGPELAHRVMALLTLVYFVALYRSMGLLHYFLERTVRLTLELEEARDRAERQARVDPLTGISNRRAFQEEAAIAIERARRYRRPLSILLLDLDHFKTVNDRHGHAAGDAVLRSCAAAITGALRAADLVGRLGGEELAVLLPETEVGEAARLAERVRELLARDAVAWEGGELRYTCSIGVASTLRDGDDLDALLARGDAALYAAKASGRNRVVVDAAAVTS